MAEKSSVLYSESLWKWAQESTHIGTWYYDKLADKLYWSHGTYRIHEKDPKEAVFIEKAIESYVEEDQPRISYAVDKGIQEGKPWNLTLKIKTDKGNIRSVRSIGRPVFNDEKQLIRLEGLFLELELSQKVQEEMLELSHKNLDIESIIDDVSIIARADLKGNITYANNQFCKISGYSREELIGQNHRIINSGYHGKEFFREMWNTILVKNELWRGEIRNRSKDGKIYWVDTIIKPILDGNGEVVEFLSVRRDITFLKEKLDTDVKLARLAAVGETTAQIVHDVMNPLAIISGNIERIDRMIEKGMDDEKLGRLTGRMMQSVDRIQEIFKSLRSSLMGETRVRFFSMKALLKNAIQELEVFIEQENFDISLDTEIDFDFVGNDTQLRQVFVNLIKNSIQANMDNNEKWVRLSILKIGGYKVVQITDSGKGIPPEVSERMFDTLFTTKGDSGGTGLGLGLCKQIIEAHNGKISLNKTNPNTQFEIVFKET